MMQGLSWAIRFVRYLFGINGVTLSAEDLAMKKDRDEWLASNMLVPTVFIFINFWTNSIPFSGKHVFIPLLPILVAYAIFEESYENEYMVHI